MSCSMSAQGRDLSGPQIKSLLRYLHPASIVKGAPTLAGTSAACAFHSSLNVREHKVGQK
jgi:hypothetical protein